VPCIVYPITFLKYITSNKSWIKETPN